MGRTHAAADAIGFAVRKDIRNNPVREVDRVRQRELWETALVVVVVLTIVLVSAWQRFELRGYGYDLERLRREQAAEESLNRQLRLEIETLRSPRRIEKLAIEQLHLVAPSAGEAIVIERATPAAPPTKTVVARK